MHLYCIGIDYRSAPLEAREAAYRKRLRIAEFWRRHASGEAAMLVTCNRIEVYVIARTKDDALRQSEQFIRYFAEFRLGYVLSGQEEVFTHALRLACGLESQLKGEWQIVEQLKHWIAQPGMPYLPTKLFSEALSLAKVIRQKVGLAEQGDSIADLVLSDIQEKFSPSVQPEIAVVGTGKIAELFTKQRTAEGRISFVAHKHYALARAFAAKTRSKAISFIELPCVLKNTDVVISATASPHFVIKKEIVTQALAKRSRPLYLYDLAMPRDIEPAVAELPNAVLYNLDDLSGLFGLRNQRLRRQIDLVEYLAKEAAGEYRGVWNEGNSENRHTAERACL